MKIFTLLAICALLSLLYCCKPIPTDGIPFYLKIDSVSVVTASQEGANTHRITDIWAEANSENLGAYELPCNFPVLQENQVTFILSAGINESGQSGVRVTYPFYQPDTFTINAQRGEKYERVPVFKYKPGTQFPFPSEDFELGNSFNGITPVMDTNVQYGTRCGMISVTAVDSNKEASQINKYDLPEGQEIWLEVDYKCSVPFIIGFYGTTVGEPVIRQPVIFITPVSGWSKIYLKLSSVIGAVRMDEYNVYFEALRPQGSGGGNVYLDNVKLLHF